MNDENAKAYFQELQQNADRISNELGFELVWQELPERTSCRIMHSLKSAPLSQKDRWPEYLKWMTKTVTAFDTVFRQRVRNLSGTTEPVDNDHP